MALNKVAYFVILTFSLTLTLSEVSGLDCYHCLNCNASNVEVVTCALPNITTSTTAPTTTTSTTNTTTTTTTTLAPPATNSSSSPNAFEIIRVERSLDDMEALYNNCECSDGLCYCDERAYLLDNITFVCVKEQHTVNGVQLVNKGCGVEFNTTQNTCQYSGYAADCTVCKTDLCNRAVSLYLPTATLIVAVLLSSLQ